MHRLLAWACLLAAFACQSEPTDLREWVPSDHQHAQTDTPPPNQTPDTSGSAAPNQFGIEEVTLVTWKRNCISCHGSLGRGDGPQGKMVKARDLTDPAWQASVTDEQIATVIVQGRGAMPGFRLPQSTVDNLVRLIRLLDAGRQPASAPSGESPPGAESAAADAAGPKSPTVSR